MNNLRMHSLWLLIISTFFLGSCVTSDDGGNKALSPINIKRVKDYPDHVFDVKQYVKGMKKGGHNLLIWEDPSADFSKYKTVNVATFGSRLLPVQNRFSYSPFVKVLNSSLKSGITLKRSSSPSALTVIGEIVECNPGNRGARALAGLYGAGKAAGAIACEVYEPGKSHPSLRIYARDRTTAAGDSASMLNHIFNQVGFRVANTLNTKIGR